MTKQEEDASKEAFEKYDFKGDSEKNVHDFNNGFEEGIIMSIVNSYMPRSEAYYHGLGEGIKFATENDYENHWLRKLLKEKGYL